MALPDAGEPVRVQITYWLLPEPGAEQVPISVLTPGATRIASLRAFVTGPGDQGPQEEIPGTGLEDHEGIPQTGPAEAGEIPGIDLEELRKRYWEGSVPIPRELARLGDSLSLRFDYQVEGAWGRGGRIELPLIVPRWNPLQPTPTTFMATVEIPRGRTVTGSFPSSVLARPPPDAGGPFQLGLQGVPAMLVLHLAEGGGPLLTLPRFLDALVASILLVMGLLGVRYLRGRAS